MMFQGWYEVLRVEGHEQNIDVTMVCPGPVFSSLLDTAFTDSPGKVSWVTVTLRLCVCVCVCVLHVCVCVVHACVCVCLCV